MLPALPNDVKSLMNWTWTEIEPHYQDLAARELSASNVKEWLADWSALGERIGEMRSRLSVATSANTADKEAEEHFKSFLDHIYLQVEAAEQKLRKKL